MPLPFSPVFSELRGGWGVCPALPCSAELSFLCCVFPEPVKELWISISGFESLGAPDEFHGLRAVHSNPYEKRFSNKQLRRRRSTPARLIIRLNSVAPSGPRLLLRWPTQRD